jgi:hypothetical protein
MRIALCLTAATLGLVAVPAAVTVAAEPAATKQPKAKNDPNRPICRRMEESGSLARTRRVCMTKAEWDRLAERSRNDSMAGSMTGGTSGN